MKTKSIDEVQKAEVALQEFEMLELKGGVGVSLVLPIMANSNCICAGSSCTARSCY